MPPGDKAVWCGYSLGSCSIAYGQWRGDGPISATGSSEWVVIYAKQSRNNRGMRVYGEDTLLARSLEGYSFLSPSLCASLGSSVMSEKLQWLDEPWTTTERIRISTTTRLQYLTTSSYHNATIVFNSLPAYRWFDWSVISCPSIFLLFVMRISACSVQLVKVARSFRYTISNFEDMYASDVDVTHPFRAWSPSPATGRDIPYEPHVIKVGRDGSKG